MADRMAVMNGGLLQQYDTPARVFDAPVNVFVAGFVGSPAMNLVPAIVVNEGGGFILRGSAGWHFPLSPRNARKAVAATGPGVILGARHSTIALHRTAIPDTMPGRIYTVEPTGDITFAHVRVGEANLVVSVTPDVRLAMDDDVWLGFDQNRLHLFDGATGGAL